MEVVLLGDQQVPGMGEEVVGGIIQEHVVPVARRVATKVNVESSENGDIMDESQVCQLEAKIETLIEKTNKIEVGIYGNGKDGLKERVKALEIKFWVFVILFLPVPGYAIKKLFFC